MRAVDVGLIDMRQMQSMYSNVQKLKDLTETMPWHDMVVMGAYRC